MWKTRIGLALIGLFITFSLSAETIYLKNGKTLIGRIIKYSAQSITVEAIGSQDTLEIPKSVVYLVNFDHNSENRYIKYKKDMAANIVYLKNGEIIIGRITGYNTQFVTIESLKGQGVLQMPTSEVNMITTMDTAVDMNQRDGIGYVQQKSTLNGANGSVNYTSDKFSYKFFLDEDSFGNILFAFGNTNTNGSVLKVFAADYRMGWIYRRFRNVLMYYGASAGLLQIQDDANGINGSGSAFSGFMGAEMFFTSLPNFGFSGELAVSSVSAGGYSATNFGMTNFPSFSIHYYF